MSRTSVKPSMSSATLSDASMYSGPLRRIAPAQHQRPDAVRIAESDQAVPDDHRHHRKAAAAAPVNRSQRAENIRRRGARLAGMRQLAGQHIQQHFGIRTGVQVPAIFANQHFGQFGGVGQIAVVAEADAVGRVDEKRLRFGGGVAAGGGIADMADADVALQRQHVAMLEHIPHQAGLLAQEQLAFVEGHDAGGILAAMLQHRQRVIDLLIGRRVADDSDDSTHALRPPVMKLQQSIAQPDDGASGPVLQACACRSRQTSESSRRIRRRKASGWIASTICT